MTLKLNLVRTRTVMSKVPCGNRYTTGFGPAAAQSVLAISPQQSSDHKKEIILKEVSRNHTIQFFPKLVLSFSAQVEPVAE